MLKTILLVATVIFFAMNMGASGIAPAFAASYGGKLIKRYKAIILFGIFVVLGAVISGRNVAFTLGKNFLPREVLTFDVALIILIAATLSLFIANILRIPQSTSQVTVGAIVGAGLFFQHLNTKLLFFKIIPFWIILPALSYVFTFFLCRKIYPPKHDNLHIYEHLFANDKKIRISSLVVSCYVAFAIGSNNVANAVGPLFGAGILGTGLGLILVAPLFSLGALVLGKGTLETAGREIVPLGNVSSTIVSFVTASLLLCASLLGIPQSLVQLNILSIFAISCVKNGHEHTFGYHLTKKTFFIWVITPIISIIIAYILLRIFYG